MKSTLKKATSVIGIIVGVIIIIIGFSLQNTSNYSIGEQIKFGADFYTEMYDVTKDVGRAINHAINDLICAVGWLIISIGAIDICFFGFKLVQSADSPTQSNIEHTNKTVQPLTVSPMIKSEEKATCDAVEKDAKAVPKEEKCEICDEYFEHLTYCKIKDDMGTRYRNICDECIQKYNAIQKK